MCVPLLHGDWEVARCLFRQRILLLGATRLSYDEEIAVFELRVCAMKQSRRV